MAWKDTRTSILIPQAVKDRLDKAMKTLVATCDASQMVEWWTGDDGPTYWRWIEVMLDRNDARRTRKKRARRKKRLMQLDWRPVPASRKDM